MSDLEKDVPLAELRHKYLRKYPLERAKSSAERTPGYDSYYTRLRRTPIRLASDIVLFVSLMIFFLIITISFVSPQNGNGFITYGSLVFLGKISYDIENFFSILNHGGFTDATEIATSEILSAGAQFGITITIVISSLVHFITAIVRFSKRQSLELMHIVMDYYAKMCGAVMTFAAFGYINNSYKISGATSFGLVMLGIILIGCSVALFISNRKNNKISKKLWIANIVSSVFGLLSVAILGTSRLGSATLLVAKSLSYPLDFFTTAMILVFIAFFVVFSSTNNIVQNSFLHMLTLNEEREVPKIKNYSPMASAITMFVSSFIMVVLTLFCLTASEFKFYPYNIVAQGIFVALFSFVLLVVSIIFRKPKTSTASIITEATEKKTSNPTPKPVPKPIPKPMPKPAVKNEVATEQIKNEANEQNISKPVVATKPVPKPIPKPVPKPVNSTTQEAPKPKVVIKMPKPKQ